MFAVFETGGKQYKVSEGDIIFVEKLGVEPSEVTDSANFTNDLGADSLDSVDLIMALENKFNLEQDDDAEGKIVTVADAIAYVEKKVAEREAK